MPTWELIADYPIWLVLGCLILGAWSEWRAVNKLSGEITHHTGGCVGEQELPLGFLHHLRLGQLADVPPRFLLPPRSGGRPLDRRPFARLVVEYTKARQGFLG